MNLTCISTALHCICLSCHGQSRISFAAANRHEPQYAHWNVFYALKLQLSASIQHAEYKKKHIHKWKINSLRAKWDIVFVCFCLLCIASCLAFIHTTRAHIRYEVKWVSCFVRFFSLHWYGSSCHLFPYFHHQFKGSHKFNGLKQQCHLYAHKR